MKRAATAIYTFLKTNGRQSLDLLLGTHCLGCGVVGQERLCATCSKSIQRPDYCCRRCGIAMVEQTQSGCCLSCLKKPPPFVDINYVGNYQERLADWIVRAKIHRQTEAIEALLLLTKAYFQAPGIESFRDYALLPMPIPQFRLMSRGFNLPLLLAKVIHKQLGNDIVDSCVVKMPKWRKKQAKLSKKQRQKQSQTFQISQKLPEKLLIIDDVVTTGSTVRALSESVRKNGAKQVRVWCLARSQPS